MPVSPGASGMQPRDPCRPWRGTLASGHKPRWGLLALQSLESNPHLSFATRMEDWTCLGQHKRHPEFPVVTRESRRNSRKTTWLPSHRKMKPFPATALEGVIVEENSVISMGVYISQSTKIYNRMTGEISYGRVPAGSVVVSGSLPAKDGSHSLYCAVIVKQVTADTRAKTSLNDLLRD